MKSRRVSILVVLIAALLALAALLSIRRLKVDTSLASLFDEHDPASHAVVQVLDHFSAVEELLLFVETPASQPPQPEKLTAFAARLEQAMAADPVASSLSDGLSYQVDPQMRAFIEKVLVPNALFYLDDGAFKAAKERLTKPQMIATLHRDETMMSTPGPAADALAKVLLKDPLRLHEFLLDRMAGHLPFSPESANGGGAFLSNDGRGLLIRVRGRRPVSDLEFAKEFTAVTHAIAGGVNTDHLSIDYSGAYAIATRSEQAIRHDMIESVVSSVICLQVLFIFAYRRPFRSFLLAFLPVALGLLYGFGVYAMFAHALTPMTAVIGGVLAGMAIDYAIAVLAFYHAQRATREPDDAAGSMLRRIGTAIIAAWATSVAGFVVMHFSHVKALRDFSLVGGLGLTGAFLCAVTVLPALLVLLDRSGNRDLTRTRISAERFLPSLVRWRWAVLGVSCATFAGAVIVLALPGQILPLESDLTVMHPRPNAPLDAQDKIAQRMGASPGSLIIHMNAADSAALLHLAHEVDVRMQEPAVKAAGIVGTFGLASLLPDPAVVPERIAATGPALADRVVADFKSALANSIFDASAYKPYEEFLRTILTATKAPDISMLMQYPRLAETILPSSATRAGTLPTEAITLVFLNDPAEHRETRDAAVNAVRSALGNLPGVTLTGISVLNYDTEITVRHDLPRLVLIALLVVTAYLAIHFRNLPDSLMAILPTIFSFACLLAFMRLSGQRLNMINLIAFPLLIGIDVDYGIFLVSAARQRDIRGLSMEEVIERVAPAASAVLLCAAATLLGFGSLAFTSVPAARSLGWAVTVGVASCAAAALLLVMPLCFVLHARRLHNGPKL